MAVGWEKGVMLADVVGESLFKGLVYIDLNHDKPIIPYHLSKHFFYRVIPANCYKRNQHISASEKGKTIPKKVL